MSSIESLFSEEAFTWRISSSRSSGNVRDKLGTLRTLLCDVIVILEEELLDIVVEELIVLSVETVPRVCSSAAIPFKPRKPRPVSPCLEYTCLLEYDCCVTLLAVFMDVVVVVPAVVESSSFIITVTGFGSRVLSLVRSSVDCDLAPVERPDVFGAPYVLETSIDTGRRL